MNIKLIVFVAAAFCFAFAETEESNAQIYRTPARVASEGVRPSWARTPQPSYRLSSSELNMAKYQAQSILARQAEAQRRAWAYQDAMRRRHTQSYIILPRPCYPANGYQRYPYGYRY